MIQKVTGAQPFQVNASNFSIGPSNEGYTLQISANGVDYSDLFTVGANTTRMVTGVANGSFYRLSGNESEVAINWNKQCSDGSGGGSGAQGPQGPQGYQGPAGAGDPQEVQDMIDASILGFSAELEEGDPIVGMAAQLYSPDGVESVGEFNYRTTAGSEDVNSGDAELRVIGGNSTYPAATYNDSASLSRGGEPETGFTYDIEWGNFRSEVEFQNNTDISNYGAKIVMAEGVQAGVFVHFLTSDNLNIGVRYTNGQWVVDMNCTLIDTNQFSFNNGLITCTTGDTVSATATITGGTAIWVRVWGDNKACDKYLMTLGEDIPNDIAYGTNDYEYSDSAWTPSLPQALRNMQLDGNAYSPEEGGVITIVRSISKSGSASYPDAKHFVALGLNSFSKDGDTEISSFSEDVDGYFVVIKAVAGLENGYVAYSENSGLTYVGICATADGAPDTASTVFGETVSVAYPTSEKPYLIIGTTDIDGLCVHPRWSGIKDEEYEEYSESVVVLSAVTADCPLYSVGDVRNTIDLKNGKAYKRIYTESYTSAAVDALIEDGKVLGTDFDFDENLIYIVGEVSASDITVEYKYKDNDFSVEYFADNSGITANKVFAETYYMTNLVDKLRRMSSDFKHLDSLNADGETGITYEYNGTLMTWNPDSGYTAEWLKPIQNTGDDEGTGLIFTNIPDGTTLFDIKASSGDWRKVAYSGDTLYLTETAGTVVCAVTVGNSFIFETQMYGNIRRVYGIYEKNYLGFRRASSTQLQNVWDGKVNGGHYELVDKYNYPYLGSSSDQGTGIPVWNGLGQVVRSAGGVSTKNIYINTTGSSSSNRTSFYTNGTNNGPDRFFVPVTGGDQGQILTSAGSNAAPTWATMIKSVKISSDDYEALTTKDPNTLYLIVDE